MNQLPLLDDMRLFCLVVRKRSFVASANELGSSPAYVTKRIAQLENTLKVTLLHRTTRSVAVTEAGEVVYQWAQKILEDVEQMTDTLNIGQSLPRGLLRICTSSGFGRNRVAPAVSKLVTQYPTLEVRLEFLDRAVDLIGEGFDVDIRLGRVHEPHLIAKCLASNERVLCAAPSYLKRYKSPVMLEDLVKHKCMAIHERDQTFSVWRMQGPNGIESVKVSGPLSANNGEAAHRWALDGHGIILRSMWDVAQSLREGRLVRVLPEYHQQADVWAVYSSRANTSGKVNIFLQFMENFLKTDGISPTSK